MEIKDISTKEKFVQVLKFFCFSISAGIVQIVTFTLLNELAKFPYWPSYLTSLILSVLWNFTFNRKFTFKSAKNIPTAMALVFAYYVVFTPLSTLWGDALTKTAGWNEYLVLALTMVINFVTELLYNQFVVYRKDMNTAKPKDEKVSENVEISNDQKTKDENK